MKYKIKAEVMQDGSYRFKPMKKVCWFLPWVRIQGSVFSTLEKAQDYLDTYIRSKRRDSVDHTFNIPYQEE